MVQDSRGRIPRMELSSHDQEFPIPISTTYGGGHGHMIHRHHHDSPADVPPHDNKNIPQRPSGGKNNGQGYNKDHHDDHHQDKHHHHVHVPYNSEKQMGVKYKECLKNHAASMGGSATDGCGEFMPSGEEGTIEALACSACSCHRNFHRKVVEGELVLYPPPPQLPPPPPQNLYDNNSKLILAHHHHKNRSAVPHQMIMSPYMGGTDGSNAYIHNSTSDYRTDVYNHHHHNHHHGGQMGMMTKKRFRTKFTQEQKEKMLSFAEKVGWKLQRQEESVIQQFCQEIGIKRRVLKVWMHNNKHNLAKNNNNNKNTENVASSA